ncbi:MAG TPA: hypothetical protein VEC36_03070 [Patescibacteria group bacterium]|nr:hypothetical protein [Patescibacteria group bacterium]
MNYYPFFILTKLMKLTMFFGLVLIISSCTKQPRPDQIIFGNDECFKLLPGDKEIIKSQHIVDQYEELCAIKGVQTPLNKTIKTSRGHIFIALSPETELNSIELAQKRDTSYDILGTRSTEIIKRKAKSYFLRKADEYICRIVYTDAGSYGIVVFNFVYSDSLEAASTFHKTLFLEERLHCE